MGAPTHFWASRSWSRRLWTRSSLVSAGCRCPCWRVNHCQSSFRIGVATTLGGHTPSGLKILNMWLAMVQLNLTNRLSLFWQLFC